MSAVPIPIAAIASLVGGATLVSLLAGRCALQEFIHVCLW